LLLHLVFRQIFAARIDELIEGKVPFTLRIEDPMANSWIYSPTAPDPDPRLSHEHYERSHEENLELGLLDMKTEGYGEEDNEVVPVVGAGLASDSVVASGEIGATQVPNEAVSSATEV
jgi:hypothetical protein